MARYQLLVDREGRVLIATEQPVTEAEKAQITAAFTRWKENASPVLLIAGEAEVIRVVDIELHVEARAAAAGEGS